MNRRVIKGNKKKKGIHGWCNGFLSNGLSLVTRMTAAAIIFSMHNYTRVYRSKAGGKELCTVSPFFFFFFVCFYLELVRDLIGLNTIQQRSYQ